MDIFPKSAYSQMWGLALKLGFLILTMTVVAIITMLIIRIIPFKIPDSIVKFLLIAAVLISGYYWFLWFT
ncbi:hypothetical protein [Aquibacillus rhizosphaerae]|uniref:Uncharacterized protein n=1 Tax=Aquibacillus rhizosphaerae TaxID=3051431 RepID=A0ABT7LAF2_9BACI|nr:hypothetical protein [Aquibacillus sp. LR5S19]MDL4842822.1 hypothetical protein [Aquibacillus sp. LR5S19]